MARNEEKQQGRLNRLWLHKEREEGRLKDAVERRPKLSTLNTASSVKKWIPSIKNEIEYYLQQSQLSHYPERKIAEFQLHIEALEKEYKSFITKLRVLDPSNKHKPWTPRAYCKRRADKRDSPTIVKNPRPCDSHNGRSQQSETATNFASTWTESFSSSASTFSEGKLQTFIPTSMSSETSEPACAVQDQPLSFDGTRLAVAAAAFRGPSAQLSSSQSQRLAKMLQAGLPNLNNFSSESRDKMKNNETLDGLVVGQNAVVHSKTSVDGAADWVPEQSSSTETTEERTAHVLGLGCYSSSDEDCDTFGLMETVAPTKKQQSNFSNPRKQTQNVTKTTMALAFFFFILAEKEV
ncbi:uncharacterized protein KZ484_006852 [Pholidichthys leucotaenia]